MARELVRRARNAGVALTGPGGFLKAMTKTVIEAAVDEELSEHLGDDRHDLAGHGSGNSGNGTRSKTVLTDSCGSVDIDVPRDRAGTVEPHIVNKGQRRLTDIDEVILSLYARGLTAGEISAHFADIYGAEVSLLIGAGVRRCVTFGLEFGDCPRGAFPEHHGGDPAADHCDDQGHPR